MNSFCNIIKVLALLFLTFNTLAADTENYLFQAKVVDLGFKYTHMQLGRDKNEIYQTTLPGYVFLPARKIARIQRNQINRSTPVDAAISEYSSWYNSDQNWIVENFVPTEQDTVENYLANKKVLNRNKELFSKHKSTEVWGVMYYQDYALVIISNNHQKHLSRTLSFKKVKNEWKRTHILADDLVVDLVNNAFRRNQYQRQ